MYIYVCVVYIYQNRNMYIYTTHIIYTREKRRSGSAILGVIVDVT